LGSSSALILVEDSPGFLLERSGVIGCNGGDETKEFKYVLFKRSGGSRVVNCTFAQKFGLGPALVFYDEDGKEIGGYVVDGCLFDEIEAKGRAAAMNGTEAIRVRDSARSRSLGRAQIRGNLFRRCGSAGEPEVISLKCGENGVEGNVFVDCAGGATSRHGTRNVFRRNYFYNCAVGVRAIDEGHVIEGNYFEGQRGNDGPRGAVVLLHGMPNSALNGYFAAHGCVVRGNRWVDCERPYVVTNMGKGELSIAPTGIVYEDNGPGEKRAAPLTVAMVGMMAGQGGTEPPTEPTGPGAGELAALRAEVAALGARLEMQERRWAVVAKAFGGL
jgi:hypothetical protein